MDELTLIGCLVGDVIFGMILVLILQKIFPRESTDRLSYVAAGMMSISSAVYSFRSSILTFLFSSLVGTVIFGTLFLGLWRTINMNRGNRLKVHNGAVTFTTQPSVSDPVLKEDLICPQCGFKQPVINNYCRRCGLQLKSTKPT